MPRDEIPEELRRFVLTSVPSVPFVEAMLIFRDTRRKPLETALIARRLYLGDRAAAEVVKQLLDMGVIEPGEAPQTHRFAPSPELQEMLDVLASYYRTHLVEITDMIHSKTARKAQQFADAFKFRKDS